MKKTLFILFILCSSVVSASPFWGGSILPDFFVKDTILTKGSYLVENNVKIGKNATVTFKAGCKIYFRKGASVKVDGGIVFEGLSRTNIDITSENKEEEGYGFIISGSNPKAEISINYTNFSNLLVPLNFEKNWVRASVTIENSSFQYINTGEPSIIINKPDEITATEDISFFFSTNNFIYNNSSIFIESLDSDVLDLQFYNNLITCNYYFGFELGGALYAPVSTSFNNKDAKHQAVFLGNSIYNNYMLHDVTDSIIQEVNFGIKGRGENFSLDNNYFGNKTSSEIQKTFDHSNNNSSAPFLSAAKPLKTPAAKAHCHIYKVLFNGVEPLLNKRPELTQEALEITIAYNRPLQIREGVQYITYSYQDTTANKIVKVGLQSKLTVDKEKFTIVFTINDNIYLKQKIGYFTIAGLIDNEGFMIPRIEFGKELFHNTFEKQ